MLPDETDPKQKGAGEFLRQRVKDLDRLTTDVSSIFFGVNISCAQCHDHPLVRDWKQDHFYGMKSFFSRTFDERRLPGRARLRHRQVQDDQGRGAPGPDDVPDRQGGRRRPACKEPTGEEQKKEKERLDDAKKKKMPPPPPKFSARAKLVEAGAAAGPARFLRPRRSSTASGIGSSATGW